MMVVLCQETHCSLVVVAWIHDDVFVLSFEFAHIYNILFSLFFIFNCNLVITVVFCRTGMWYLQFDVHCQIVQVRTSNSVSLYLSTFPASISVL